ncbi:NUDIX hydrolase [Candidatus Uabimicrobium sp. HlEnr_7]|uniref:NUDIX hydrolase n=1 Tax=Candidatus Uabimicrobium helgolandensis TaxID=3095367 RepID=UPI003557B601
MDELTTHIFKITSSKPYNDNHKYYCIECPDWVNIVAIATTGEIILVKQYRYGINDMTLELPAGMVDNEDNNPLEAARRELLEETGYGKGQWISLGWMHPNPAIQNNRCHSFLAKNVEKIADIKNDLHENTEPVLISPTTMEDWICTGKITHSLAISAFYLYQNLRK